MTSNNPHWDEALTVPFVDKQGWAYFPGVVSRKWLEEKRGLITACLREPFYFLASWTGIDRWGWASPSLAQALGYTAARAGHSVRFIRVGVQERLDV